MSRSGVCESEQDAVLTKESSRENLATHYCPPFHWMFHGPFDKGKTGSIIQDKWILVNIQSTKEFTSHMLNQYTWANEAVSQTISANFIFWQVYDDTTEGKKVFTYYKLKLHPVLLIINPNTGQKMRSWFGKIQPERLLVGLVPFLGAGPKSHPITFCQSCTRESSCTPKSKGFLQDLTVKYRMYRTVDELQHLVHDILSKLPVKSLLRFKCVKKSWCRMITNPDFILKHLLSFKQINTIDHIALLVLHFTSLLPNNCIGKAASKLSINQATNSSSLSMLDDGSTFPISQRISGPCNGLYLFFSRYNTFLVNPSMREYRRVPDYHFSDEQRHTADIGFDTRSNDYKIIVFSNSLSNEPWQASLYSLSSNCWREVDCTLPSYINSTFREIYTFVHGAIHWLACDDKEDPLIVAFDMTDEKFRVIRFESPQIEAEPYRPFCVDLCLAKYKESLGVFHTDRAALGLDLLHFWVLEEYGNERSWTKHLTIELGYRLDLEELCGFWKDDQLIVLDIKKGIVLYDLQTKETKPVAGLIGDYRYFDAVVYEESVVSLRRDEDYDHNQEVVHLFDRVQDDKNQDGVHYLEMIHDPLFH